MSYFSIGSVVRVHEPDPWELVSWRDDSGALCGPPPSCEMTVKSCDGDKFAAQWFEGTTLKEDTFSVRDFYVVRS